MSGAPTGSPRRSTAARTVVDGDLSLRRRPRRQYSRVHASYRYDATAQHLDLKLAVDGLDPTALAPLAPALAPLAQAQMPVSGTIATAL